MNFDQAKALRLQQWRSTLDNHSFRIQNPEAYRQTLHSMSQGLADEGLIDKLEQFDMDELANAAYWHAIEELQSPSESYCGASRYDVVDGDGIIRARIGQSIFDWEKTADEGPARSYDAKIYSDTTGANLVFNPSREVARIEGLTLTMADGRQFQLIETGRMILGVVHQPIEDPDIYRALVDAMQIAQEEHDLAAHEKLRPLIELAKFHSCPTCLDRFGHRDECPTCAGTGFVTKRVVTGLR
ncbi:hypothetical protein QF019_002494 [Pseudomonas frederiksbergensis]|uniref:hypothetical protein n=1 Tax=Pseudomonas frederiksbergensis TaxID=104087 RepID=UPI003D1B955E